MLHKSVPARLKDVLHKVRDHSEYYKIRPEALEKARAEAPETPPHYGAELDLLVRATAHNPRPKGAGAEYDRIKPYFDAAYYFASNPDIARVSFDPVWHYMRAGAAEERNPSAFFETATYRKLYSNDLNPRRTPLDHWVTKGRAEGRITLPMFEADMPRVLGHSQAELRTLYEERFNDLQARLATGELGRMVERAADWDPLVQRAWPAAFKLRVLPFSTFRITDRIASLYEFQAALDWRRARIVLINGSPTPSRVFTTLVQSAVDAVGPEEVVVIHTAIKMKDAAETGTDTPTIDPKVRQLHFGRQWERVPVDNTRLLVDIVRSLRPAAAIGYNATLFHAALRSYGAAMRAAFKVMAMTPTPRATPLGYFDLKPEDAFYRLMPLCDVMICHDYPERRKFIAAYNLPEADAERLQPVEILCNSNNLLRYAGLEEEATA